LPPWSVPRIPMIEHVFESTHRRCSSSIRISSCSRSWRRCLMINWRDSLSTIG